MPRAPKSKPFVLKSINDLKAAPYNPRTITTEALAGLKESIGRFGDLSGLVFNARTGNMVAGHQRLRSLKEQYGERLKLEDGCIVTPDGHRFAVRVVDWDADTEVLANITANNPAIAGTFTDDLRNLIQGLQDSDLSNLIEPLNIDKLLKDTTGPDSDSKGAGDGAVGGGAPKFLIVITCDHEDHQVALLERFMGEGLECRALTS